MKLIRLSKNPEMWINIGTGTVSRVCELLNPETDQMVAGVVLNNGFELYTGGSVVSLVNTLKSQEQNYERN